jgi:FlaA1/EpsC-like NDP-sugar epimerase
MEKYFKNKTILITGGTGYLGRALTKRLLKYKPKSIELQV